MHQHKTTMGWLHCHQALSEGHVDLAEFLLDKGADLTAQAEDGLICHRLMELTRILLGRGADPTTRLSSDRT